MESLIERTEEVLSRVREGAIAALQACLDQREDQVRHLVDLVKAMDAEALRQEEWFAVTWARLQHLGQEVTLAMTARHARARTAFSEINQRRTMATTYGRSGRRPTSLLSVEG